MFKVSLPTMAQKVGIYHKKVKKKKKTNTVQSSFSTGWKSLFDHNYIKPVFFTYGSRY